MYQISLSIKSKIINILKLLSNWVCNILPLTQNDPWTGSNKAFVVPNDVDITNNRYGTCFIG
jgi:hypothetical protein